MKTVGIIAEYNPFHSGHQYQIKYTKDILGADYTIIAMSGDFVQRGTPALFPKHLRAEMALRGGADLVLELPVSVSTASAEFFASGGVNLLNRLGVVDTLCFGCENNLPALFEETSKILVEEPEFYKNELQNALKKGNSFPLARSIALLKYFRDSKIFADIPENVLDKFFNSPNNILGIEYCKAIIRQNSSIIAHPLKREGADYHELDMTDHKFPSASGIRHLLTEKSCHDIRKQSGDCKETAAFIKHSLKTMVPDSSLDLIESAIAQNQHVSDRNLDLLLQYRLLEETAQSLTSYLDVSVELARRIMHSRNQYQSFAQFTELLKTKELTLTRIQRALLHILLKIKKTPDSVPYARILGFRKSAGPLLKEIKKNSQIPLISKLASADSFLDSNGQQILTENTFASNLYESILQQNARNAFRHEYTKPVIIL